MSDTVTTVGGAVPAEDMGPVAGAPQVQGNAVPQEDMGPADGAQPSTTMQQPPPPHTLPSPPQAMNPSPLLTAAGSAVAPAIYRTAQKTPVINKLLPSAPTPQASVSVTPFQPEPFTPPTQPWKPPVMTPSGQPVDPNVPSSVYNYMQGANSEVGNQYSDVPVRGKNITQARQFADEHLQRQAAREAYEKANPGKTISDSGIEGVNASDYYSQKADELQKLKDLQAARDAADQAALEKAKAEHSETQTRAEAEHIAKQKLEAGIPGTKMIKGLVPTVAATVANLQSFGNPTGQHGGQAAIGGLGLAGTALSKAVPLVEKYGPTVARIAPKFAQGAIEAASNLAPKSVRNALEFGGALTGLATPFINEGIRQTQKPSAESAISTASGALSIPAQVGMYLMHPETAQAATLRDNPIYEPGMSVLEGSRLPPQRKAKGGKIKK